MIRRVEAKSEWKVFIDGKMNGYAVPSSEPELASGLEQVVRFTPSPKTYLAMRMLGRIACRECILNPKYDGGRSSVALFQESIAVCTGVDPEEAQRTGIPQAKLTLKDTHLSISTIVNLYAHSDAIPCQVFAKTRK